MQAGTTKEKRKHRAALSLPFIIIIILLTFHSSSSFLLPLVNGVPASNPTLGPNDDLHIGGLLPYHAYPCYTLAAVYAVSDINNGSILGDSSRLQQQQQRLLPTNNLTITFNDTMQDSSICIASALYQMEVEHAFALLGELMSGATLPMATLSSAFMTPTVAPQATVQDLSNKGLFPYFARSVGGDDQQAYALHSMMTYFGWLEAQLLYATDTYGTAFAADLQAVASAVGRNGSTSVRFTAVNSFATTDTVSINAAISAMVDADSPIVVLLASRSADARTVASILIQRGLLGRFQFVGCDGWFHTATIARTPSAQLANYTAFLKGIVGTLPLIPSSDAVFQLNRRIRDGAPFMIGDQPIPQFLIDSAPSCNVNDTTSGYFYDAVLMIAHGASIAVSAGKTLSGKNTMDAILSGDLAFQGLTGDVLINEHGDRFAAYSFMNYADGFSNIQAFGDWSQAARPISTGAGASTMRGTNPYIINPFGRPIFINGSLTPPASSRPRTIRVLFTSQILAGFMSGSIILCVIIGILPLILILLLRHHVAFKSGNVPLISVFLVGVMLSCFYPTIASLPLDTQSSYSIESTCIMPYLVVCFGFNCIFSSLFSKTRNIESIFRNRELRMVSYSKGLRPYRITFILLLIDSVLFIAWTKTDKPYLTLHPDSHSSNSSEDYYQCTQSYTLLWQLCLILPKYVMMLMTAYTAWKIREVPHAFNESRFLALILYNLLFISSLVLLLVNLIDDPLASLFISSLGVWFCISVSVGLLIIPKLLIIAGGLRKNANQQAVVPPIASPVAVVPPTPVIVRNPTHFDFNHSSMIEKSKLRQAYLAAAEAERLGINKRGGGGHAHHPPLQQQTNHTTSEHQVSEDEPAPLVLDGESDPNGLDAATQQSAGHSILYSAAGGGDNAEPALSILSHTPQAIDAHDASASQNHHHHKRQHSHHQPHQQQQAQQQIQMSYMRTRSSSSIALDPAPAVSSVGVSPKAVSTFIMPDGSVIPQRKRALSINIPPAHGPARIATTPIEVSRLQPLPPYNTPSPLPGHSLMSTGEVSHHRNDQHEESTLRPRRLSAHHCAIQPHNSGKLVLRRKSMSAAVLSPSLDASIATAAAVDQSVGQDYAADFQMTLQ